MYQPLKAVGLFLILKNGLRELKRTFLPAEPQPISTFGYLLLKYQIRRIEFYVNIFISTEDFYVQKNFCVQKNY